MLTRLNINRHSYTYKSRAENQIPCTTQLSHRKKSHSSIKGKGKLTLFLAMKAPEGERVKVLALKSLTSALDRGGWLTLCSGCLTPVKETRYLSCRRLDGKKDQSGRVRKIPTDRHSFPGPSNPSNSLYRLGHPGSKRTKFLFKEKGI